MFPDQELTAAHAHLNARRLPDAESAFRKIISNNPSPQAWNGLGITLGQQGRLTESESAFRRAIAIKPNFPAAYQNLAYCCRLQEHFSDAEAVYRALIQLAPSNAQTYDDLAWALMKQKKITEAIGFMQTAVQLQPRNCDFRTHLAALQYDTDHLDAAAETLAAALAIDPNHLGSRREMAKVLWQQHHFQEALLEFNKIMDAYPDEIVSRRGRAELLLQLGDFENGWRDYERRWDDPEFIKFIKLAEHRPRGFAETRWKGEDLSGKTLLLFAEQGFGDAIQFIRYAPLLAQRGAKIIVECPAPVKNILQCAQGTDRIFIHGETIPQCDYYAPMMSLPYILSSRLTSIPSDVPYLCVPEKVKEYWRRQLDEYTGAFKVGICWAGRPEHPNDYRRSSSLGYFSPLARIPNIKLFALQKGPAAAQMQSPPHGMELINFSHKLADFLDTAGLIEQLDLVISIDTAIVHLAGALAKSVWTLLAFSSEWRWLADRTDSPWYPTMRLFRQDAPGDWRALIENVAAELKKIAHSPS